MGRALGGDGGESAAGKSVWDQSPHLEFATTHYLDASWSFKPDAALLPN
jgi:hypothetical protein